MSTQFHLREMQPTDSKGISNLITEEGGMMTTHFVIDAYQAMVDYSDMRTLGVVAEAAGYDGLAGLATVRFGECQFNGRVMPFAFLDSLKVDEKFRKQGLGGQLAQWRIDRAREIYGADVLLISGTTTDNIASQNTMKKWCREFTDPFAFSLVKTLSREPQSIAGVSVREATPEEYELIAQQQNNFYKDYNLYIPVSAKSLRTEASKSPTNEPMTRHYVAVTDRGEIVAGATVRYKGNLMYDKITPPSPIRVANYFLRLLPPDMTMRDIQLKGMWYLPEQESIMGYLIHTIRYVYRDKGTVIGLLFDGRHPLVGQVKSNRLIPVPKIIYSLHGPEPMDRNRIIYAYGRA